MIAKGLHRLRVFTITENLLTRAPDWMPGGEMMNRS
jgi:hypothetical protein